MLYNGITAGGWHNHRGGGATFLCLVNELIYVSTEEVNPKTMVYTTEYETNGHVFNVGVSNSDAPCAVCYAEGRSAEIMIPRRTTHLSFILEPRIQWIYLMSSFYDNSINTEYVCVDSNPDVLLGSDADRDAAGFYFAVADCNSSFMLCGPPYYIHNAPINCAVCTR